MNKLSQSLSEHIAGQFSRAELEVIWDTDFVVSGGTGFAGKWILTVLNELFLGSKRELSAVILTRNCAHASDTFRDDRLRYLEWMDLEPSIFGQLRKPKQTVIHGAIPAASGQVITSEGLHAYSANLRKLINTAIIGCKDKPKVINLSSGGVYSRPLAGPIVETNAEERAENLTNYQKIKFLDEEMIKDFDKKGLVLGANPRLFSFTGPGLNIPGTFAISNFVGQAVAGRPVEVLGWIDSERSFMSPIDMAIWIIKCSLYPTIETLHLGASEKITMGELAVKISDKFGTGEISVKESFDGERQSYYPETKYTRSQLKISSELSLDESLEIWLSDVRRH
jgi:dTDP-glucose 4,6-dehydratase